jgi:hypothetical protein
VPAAVLTTAVQVPAARGLRVKAQVRQRFSGPTSSLTRLARPPPGGMKVTNTSDSAVASLASSTKA